MKLRLLVHCLLLSMPPCQAAGLVEVYNDALRFDSQIHEAESAYRAAREATPQAWAALLPQISATYTLSRQKQLQDTIYPFVGADGTAETYPYDVHGLTRAHGYELDLQQTLFSWSALATLPEAHKKVAQAEADYQAAQQSLMQRTATAYLNVLGSVETLQAEIAALDAVSRQLEQSRKKFDRGLISITDVNEALAAHDNASAAVIEGKRSLASALLALHEITGQDYASLAKPDENMPLELPQPADRQQWVEVSMEQNPSLLSSRLAADVARANVRVAIGGHLPTVVLNAKLNNQSQNTSESLSFGGGSDRVNFPYDSSGNQIGITLSVPIFSGGGTQSQVRQAEHLWIAAKDHVVTISRETDRTVRDAYDGIVAATQRIKVLRQGVATAQQAVKAAEAAYEVGLRTALEVLQERETLVQAQTAYATARYNYMVDIVQLHLAAGTLRPDTLQSLGQWLTIEQSTDSSALDGTHLNSIEAPSTVK